VAVEGGGGARFAHKKWGPALLPAPTAPSEGSAGQKDIFRRTRLKALAHQLRRRFPPYRSLVRGASIFYSTAPPGGSLVFQSSRLTRKSKPFDVPRPFLGRPLLRPALPFRPKTSVPRRARGRSTLPAPLPDWPRKPPKSFALPVGGDRSFRRLPLSFLPLPAFRWRRGLPSRSPMHNAPRFRVGEAKNTCLSLWITGIAGTTVGTFVTIGKMPDGPRLKLPFRSPLPTS
jgi:hypothetical protein